MKKIVLLVLSLSLFLAGCVMNKVRDAQEIINLKQEMGGKNIVFEIIKGNSYSQEMKAGPFIFNLLPQVVIWAEDEDGNLIKTLYINGADGKGFRHAARNKQGEEFYRECFPTWTNRMDAGGMALPGNDNPYPDTITSATPSAGFTLNTKINPIPGLYHFYMEINQSSDYNEHYTKENSGWAGQPSLIYHAAIPGDPDSGEKKHRMELWGRGANIGEKTSPDFDITGIDTALNQVSEVWIQY